MKTFYKIIFSTILIFSVFPLSKSSAHSTCKSYGESYGYWIDCKNHTSSPQIMFNIGNVNAAYKSYISAGASHWNSTGIVLISESPVYSPNFIHTYSDPNTSTVAAFYNYHSNSSGHLTQWSIKMNTAMMNGRSYAINAATMAHELGHAIGLNDLYNSSNKNKLMYGYSSRTVTTPTTYDRTGARLILEH